MHRRFALAILATIVTTAVFAPTAGADVPAWTMTGFGVDQSTNPGQFSLGYTFGVDGGGMIIDGIGVLDIGGHTIQPSQPMLVNLYWSGPTPDAGTILTGGRIAGFNLLSVSVSSTDPILSLSGGPYTSGDGFRYHMLDTPFDLVGGTYMLQEADFGTGFKAVAKNLGVAPLLEVPYHATYTTPDSSASYATSVVDSDLPGLFGPNFLIQTPEPGAIGLLLCAGAACLRRRR